MKPYFPPYLRWNLVYVLLSKATDLHYFEYFNINFYINRKAAKKEKIRGDWAYIFHSGKTFDWEKSTIDLRYFSI